MLAKIPKGPAAVSAQWRRASKQRPSGASAGVQYCSPGVADIVAWPGPGVTLCVECKRPVGGRQSDAQRLFEGFVSRIGHMYLLATSVEDVHKVLEGSTFHEAWC